MSAAREAVLARIRAATAGVPADEASRWEGPGPAGAPDHYRRHALAGAQETIELFAERVADYRAEVVRCAAAPGDIARAVGEACERHGARAMVHAPGVPEQWLADGPSWSTDREGEPLSVAELDAADGVLTGALGGIAETGTIVLDHSPIAGRRALSLVPDLHLCVVEAPHVVATVPEGFDRLRPSVLEGLPITFVSGPSATSDIELQRVEGVHGPRRLVLLLAG